MEDKLLLQESQGEQGEAVVWIQGGKEGPVGGYTGGTLTQQYQTHTHQGFIQSARKIFVNFESTVQKNMVFQNT